MDLVASEEIQSRLAQLLDGFHEDLPIVILDASGDLGDHHSRMVRSFSKMELEMWQ